MVDDDRSWWLCSLDNSSLRHTETSNETLLRLVWFGWCEPIETAMTTTTTTMVEVFPNE